MIKKEKIEEYKKIINDFIINYNGNEKLTFSMISNEIGLNMTYVRELSDRDLIKNKNTYYTPNWVNKLKERRKSKECKDKQKIWRDNNKNYIKVDEYSKKYRLSK